jgi:hypothetical protein
MLTRERQLITGPGQMLDEMTPQTLQFQSISVVRSQILLLYVDFQHVIDDYPSPISDGD